MGYLTSSVEEITTELNEQPTIQKVTDNGDSWDVLLYFRSRKKIGWKKIGFINSPWFNMQATFTVSKRQPPTILTTMWSGVRVAGKIDKIVVTKRSGASLVEVGAME